MPLLVSPRGRRIGLHVIFIMSVTGTLLAYERQIIAWADTHQYFTQGEALSKSG